MKKVVGYSINASIKEEYDYFIEYKYGHKRNRCGSELEKAMKLYLTLQGNSKYSDDIEVKEILQSAADKISCTHAPNKNTNVEESVDDRFQKLEDELAQMKVQLVKAVSQEPPKKGSDSYRQMDSFVSRFQEEYGEYHQVSMKEIQKLVVKEHGVCDQRSIQNRVNYLQGKGIIESYAPNVYNVKL